MRTVIKAQLGCGDVSLTSRLSIVLQLPIKLVDYEFMSTYTVSCTKMYPLD
jgi:hypothetical protein